MVINRRYGPHIKRAAVMLAPLSKMVISAVGLLLMAAALYWISTDPWYQDGIFMRKMSGDFQVILDNPILGIRSTAEGIAFVVAMCLVLAPAPKVRLCEDKDTLFINIEW